MPLVSRGLLGTSHRFGRVMAVSTPDDATERAMARLKADLPHGMVWKERMEWAQSLARGKPDFHGRRVYSDAGRMDTRYVARVARAAYKTGALPKDKNAWGRLRESIRRIYQDLDRGVA